MKREVTEQDLRMPEYVGMSLEDLEFRSDGKIVRKDRWEAGMRSVASMLGFPPREGFEIGDVTAKLGQITRRLGLVRSDAERDVLAERYRQIAAEGWTPEHDDEHDDGSLAAAAACYALGDQAGELPAGWPQSWDESWWRPSADARRNLVKAGALILAEIERLDRAAAKANPDNYTDELP